MGWNNPPVPWREFSDRLRGIGPRHDDGRPRNAPPQADGGDSPAWSRKRLPYQPPSPPTGHGTAAVPYAELHCHSNFSFLDGASHPEELAEEAARLGLEALAITDHNGLYGVVRFAEAAGALGLRTVFGAELSVGGEGERQRAGGRGSVGEGERQRAGGRGSVGEGERQRAGGRGSEQRQAGNGVADPEGRHLVVIARDPTGYAALSRAVSLAQLRGSKGSPVVDLDELGELAGDHWLVLTGCRKGSVPRALTTDGLEAARRELDRLIATFGRCHVKVELWDHGDPLDTARNDALADLATRGSVETVVTNNVHYATPRRWRLASAQAAIRARRSLDELDGWLPAAGTAHLRSGEEQAARFARYPGAVEATTALAISSSFDLRLVAPQLPDFPVAAGHTEDTWLRQLTMEGALRRYGPPGAEHVSGAYLQIDRELAVIAELGFPGYFLIVWDIVEFCRRSNIYCQGRGSAANSAVCYALGITKADPVALKLLFERFLSPARDGPPDIDLDIESGRREEVIQYVYQRYGRHHTAQVANVITYRPRSAIRDAGRALGFSPGQLDRWARRLDGWGPLREVAAPAADDTKSGDAIPEPVIDLAAQLEGFPRHLGIHSGGMVICDRPVIDVCPVEWATMPDRSVLQWDKDDCAAIGLVKFDLLGLGMLEVLHRAVDLIATHQQTAVDLAHIPQEQGVYDMLCRADSIGLFQVESRAQMATLPRLKPRKFYDLVVEVALIRPGPIQGGSVHPFIRRHNGQEDITYLHPLLEKPLHKTLGVPLFQEQMMEIAVEVAGFTATEADELRQAMSAKRSHQRMERLRDRFYAGMATQGITGETADAIYTKLLAFANFGFPESHSVSFAYLVYASAWLKLHHPAAFLAALLNSQPMGFWSPQTLIADAVRHGVVVRDACVHASAATATLEPLTPTAHGAAVGESTAHVGEPPDRICPSGSPTADDGPAADIGPTVDGRVPAAQLAERAETDRRLAVRLGLSQIRTIGDELAERIATGSPYDDLEALMRHCRPTPAQAEALATAGALAVFEPDRRRALWAAGAAARARADQLERTTTGTTAPSRLPPMTLFDEVGADLWATGVTTRASPLTFVRERLRDDGVLTAADLDTAEPDRIVAVAGVVTHRQRPATAGGTTFMNLEDETGLVNVICSRGVWARYRIVARTSPALVVHGRLERAEGVVNLVAARIEALDLQLAIGRSRDFR
ncbi:MAG: error-prone DNA polymerase [Actinobacteria bacterium]|nr:error-prone DNA polymerase [Actinomycetota bacterium]